MRQHTLYIGALAVAVAVAAAGISAEARMHAPYRGHRIIPANAAPLDAFTTPSGAYSFRKLISGYAGPAIRIRRASDNLETDINFLGCTGFTGCPWDAATAAAHCASTTCFAKTWYNQAGNTSYDITQATPASQPELVFNCKGALPCLRTTGTQTLASAGTITPATGLVSFSAVGNRSVFSSGCTWLRENGNVNRLSSTAAANTWSVAPAGPSMTLADGTWHSAQGVLNVAGQTSVFNGDGGTEATNTTGAPTTAAGAIAIIGAAGTTCLFAESIGWDNYALTAGERGVLNTNQRSWYGTP